MDWLGLGAGGSSSSGWGGGNYRNQTLENINSCGVVNVENCTIQQDVNVQGTLTITGSTIRGSLSVNGSITATRTHTIGTTSINGLLTASNSSFGQGLSVSSNLVEFFNSIASSIHVRRVSDPAPQIVKLLDRSSVSGPISFEAGNGEVHLSRSASFTGPLTGGTQRQV